MRAQVAGERGAAAAEQAVAQAGAAGHCARQNSVSVLSDPTGARLPVAQAGAAGHDGRSSRFLIILATLLPLNKWSPKPEQPDTARGRAGAHRSSNGSDPPGARLPLAQAGAARHRAQQAAAHAILEDWPPYWCEAAGVSSHGEVAEVSSHGEVTGHTKHPEKPVEQPAGMGLPYDSRAPPSRFILRI